MYKICVFLSFHFGGFGGGLQPPPPGAPLLQKLCNVAIWEDEHWYCVYNNFDITVVTRVRVVFRCSLVSTEKNREKFLSEYPVIRRDSSLIPRVGYSYKCGSSNGNYIQRMDVLDPLVNVELFCGICQQKIIFDSASAQLTETRARGIIVCLL
jgi:hypothetical protein